jgi:transposase
MRRIEMEKAKEILRLYHQNGLRQREIAGATGCALGTVSNVLAKAKDAGISYPTKLTAKELGSLLYPPIVRGDGQVKPEPDLVYIHQEMQKKGITLTLLWEEYKTEHPDGLMLTQFCERYREFRKQNKVYMRKNYKAGERLMIDWAGQTMHYTDSKGKEVPAYIFVATLPSSAYMYVEPFRDMGSKAWTDGHVHALGYFGGTPQIWVPDNTKTAIVKAEYYDPKLNRAYHDMAHHYGAAVVPARSRRPTDKAPVETGVQIAERRIIAKLRNRQFLSFEELRLAVQAELEIVNTKPFQKLDISRRELFLETEQKLLIPLPKTKYEYADFKTAKVAFDYHVQFDQYYYSVPYSYAGKQVEIRATSRMIEIFWGGDRIAVHQRNYEKYTRYSTDPQHMPKKHRIVSEWSPERFISWAAKTGENTKQYIEALLESREHPEQAFKTCAGILRLGDTISKDQMETACRDALHKNIFTYKYFAVMLKNMNACKQEPIVHNNLRGSGYYGGGTHVR